MRIMFDKKSNQHRIIPLQTHASLLNSILELGSRYKMIWSTFLFDFCVLLFLIGIMI
jgi:hypothetical protein